MFNYSIEHINDFAVFTLSGRADIFGAEKLESEFKNLLAQGYNNFILDFSKVSYFSSTGMRVIIALKNKLDENGGKLRIIQMSRMVEKILKALDLYDMYEIYDNIEQAVHI